jgi:hypothetical protein
MLSNLRLLICAGVLALAGGVLELAQPGRILQWGTDVLALLRSRADLREELEIGRRLDEESAALMACAYIKQRILADLIEERLTLIETAKRYRELDRIRLNGQLNQFSMLWPGNSELERYCHQIIQAAKNELWEQPCAAATVVTRLNAELQAEVESGVFCLLR